MKSIRQLSIVLLLFVTLILPSYGQDMHFTNYQIAPTYFNPALSGNFSGTVRAGLNFRTQHEFVKSAAFATPFRTVGIYVDAPVIFGFKKNHWVGAGLTIIGNEVSIVTREADNSTKSDLSQNWSRFAPSIAYHIGLDKKFRRVVSFGVQYGATSVTYEGNGGIDEGFLTSGSTKEPLLMDELTSSTSAVNGNYSSINAGITYKALIGKTNSFELGGAVMHLQQPTWLIDSGNEAAPVYRRINIHSVYRMQSNKKLVLEPALYATFQGPQSNIQAQMRAEYKLDPKSETALIAGLGYRLGDAPQFLTGARYKDYLILISYDYALTDAALVSQHKLELGVSKLFTVNKRPKTTPTLYCPRM